MYACCRPWQSYHLHSQYYQGPQLLDPEIKWSCYANIDANVPGKDFFAGNRNVPISHVNLKWQRTHLCYDSFKTCIAFHSSITFVFSVKHAVDTYKNHFGMCLQLIKYFKVLRDKTIPKLSSSSSELRAMPLIFVFLY